MIYERRLAVIKDIKFCALYIYGMIFENDNNLKPINLTPENSISISMFEIYQKISYEMKFIVNNIRVSVKFNTIYDNIYKE